MRGREDDQNIFLELLANLRGYLRETLRECRIVFLDVFILKSVVVIFLHEGVPILAVNKLSKELFATRIRNRRRYEERIFFHGVGKVDCLQLQICPLQNICALLRVNEN